MKHFFIFTVCCFVIAQQVSCIQKNNHHETTVAVLQDSNCSLFHVPNFPHQFGLMPNTSYTQGNNTNPTMLLFNENDQNNTGKYQLFLLCDCDKENQIYYPRITSNNNITIIQTDKHLAAYRNNQTPVLFDTILKHNEPTLVSSINDLPEQSNNYFITYRITSSDTGSIMQTINAHLINDPSQYKRIFYQDHTHSHNKKLVNTIALLACHPSKHEIAFKQFNNVLSVISTHNEADRAIRTYIIPTRNCEIGESSVSYQLIKYSANGKFIALLYPCAIGVYNCDTEKIAYLTPEIESPAHHYISMAFYLNTNIIALLNCFGNINYINIETPSSYGDSHVYGHVQDIDPIRDNALLFSKDGTLVHAAVGNHLVRYTVPMSISSAQ